MDENHFHFVTELCEGGDLYEAIEEQGVFNEEDCAEIIKQLL